jgi:dTDP-4-amino-4,6-dideoxygalactose transaminase
MPVPLLDLKPQYRDLEPRIQEAVRRVFESQQFILGEEVASFERDLSHYLDGVHAIGVASGTDALLLALMALEIGEGDEVITTPYSFFATASTIHRVGARPVFVDIDPETYLMRTDLVPRAVTPRTRAILPVHLFGQMADLDPLLEIARKKSLSIIEDAAQSIGATAKVAGVVAPSGTVGTFGCFSFFPTKNLGGAGDGGLVSTRDAGLAERVRSLRRHGEESAYVHSRVGLNSRLDALQAAVLRVKLPHLESWNAARESNASRYRSLFETAGLTGIDGPIALPRQRADARHTYHQYVIRARARDELVAALKGAGIGCAIYYPIPLHLQQCFASLRHHRGDFPVAETAAHSTLALPIYPGLTESQQDEVVAAIRRFYSR